MEEPLSAMVDEENVVHAWVPYSELPTWVLQELASGHALRLPDPPEHYDVDFRRRWAMICLSARQ